MLFDEEEWWFNVFHRNKNITKTFNGVKVLDNLNINVAEGSILEFSVKVVLEKSVLINMLRGMKDYKPDKGQIIYHIAICPKCLSVEPPSLNNKNCKCGGKFEKMEVDFWNADRIFSHQAPNLNMLQRTFALYEDDTVIDNVLKSIQGHDEEESTYLAIDLLDLAQMTHRITPYSLRS